MPLGVVTGMAAANPGQAVILVAGLAEAVAGAIAMGGGSYLASEAEEGLYAAEIRDEGLEIEAEPEREVAELALILEDEGLAASQPNRFPADWPRTPTCSSEPRCKRSSASRRRWRRSDRRCTCRGSDLSLRGRRPALALLLLRDRAALPVSLVCTLAALFGARAS